LTAVASGTGLRSSSSARAVADECVGSLTSAVPGTSFRATHPRCMMLLEFEHVVGNFAHFATLD